MEASLVVYAECPSTATRDEWLYQNLDLGKPGIIYTRSGLISWQSGGNHTEYHGEFRVGHDRHSVTVRFDCHGNPDQLKTAVLLKRSEGVFSGWDYRQRWVRMTHIGTSNYCPNCKAWHVVQ